jgi:hypothetical protein
VPVLLDRFNYSNMRFHLKLWFFDYGALHVKSYVSLIMQHMMSYGSLVVEHVKSYGSLSKNSLVAVRNL